MFVNLGIFSKQPFNLKLVLQTFLKKCSNLDKWTCFCFVKRVKLEKSMKSEGVLVSKNYGSATMTIFQVYKAEQKREKLSRVPKLLSLQV